MANSVPANTADTSALVQHFLLYHGARYISRASEENWKHVPVTLEVPELTLAEGHLPGGIWLVLPWDAPTPDQLTAWLDRAMAGSPRFAVVVLVMAIPALTDVRLQSLSALFGVQIVGVSAADREAFGSPLARVLGRMFDPQQAEVLETVNPLERLVALGDPRNPEVFLERLRRAGSGSPITLLLVAVNVLVFVVMTAYGHGLANMFREFGYAQLRDAGANIAALTVGDGEAWRLLTCTFIHANLLHIGMNMFALKALGEFAERLFGSSMFTAVYLLSGLGGSIASLGWTLAGVPDMPSVGASGAVFGVMGSLLGYMMSRRASVPRPVFRGLLRYELFFLAINIVLGLSIPQIDNAAHIGGLVVGLMTGGLLSRELPPAPQPTLWVRAVALTACAGALGLAFRLAAGLVRI